MAPIFVVAALALLAAAQICGADEPKVYLSGPKLDQKVPSEMWRLALAKLKLDAKLTPSHATNMIERASEEATDEVARKVYRMLYTAWTDFGSNPEDSARLLTLIYRGMNEAELAHLKPFMLSLGKSSVGQFAERAEEVLTYQLLEPRVVGYLNRFFRAALDIGKHTSDGDVLRKLEPFDLGAADYNVASAFAVAKSIKHPLRPRGKAQIFESFLDHECMKILQDPFRWTLDTLNLAVGLKSGYEMPKKVQVVNQYWRICLAWAEKDGHERIVANFKRQHTIAVDVRKWFGSCAGEVC